MLKIIFRNTVALKINRKNFVRKKLWRDTAPLQGFFMSGFRKSTERREEIGCVLGNSGVLISNFQSVFQLG